ncbi:MAG: GAF domain-containing sensor histidine kinase [Candidatus Promineifilaceae bacterium]|nr:GAF domain-containing sensor histidine kinase [Candidatus Promineifilaceae bacterium]
MNKAALAVAGNLSLDKVLRQIVESARELANARYAALGIPDGKGGLAKFIHSGLPSEQVAQIPHEPEGHGLLGALLQEGRTIRIPHITGDPRSFGFPPGHPPMESFLGVPIKGGGEIMGNLYLTDKLGGEEFTAADEELIELLAAHAAIAIKNARLYEEVGRLAIVEERSRIGMDLHDGVIQAIYAVGLTLESARLLLPEDEHAEAVRLLDGAINGLNDAIRDIRNFILDLRPRRFNGNLSEGLARLTREFQANTMIPVELRLPGDTLDPVPAPVARALFFTAQEALANVARHARASNVVVEAEREDHAIKLRIEDDGRGFDVDSQSQMTGHGLANMRARAEEQNGTFTVESEPGEGTQISLRLPLYSSTVS